MMGSRMSGQDENGTNVVDNVNCFAKEWWGQKDQSVTHANIKLNTE